MKKYIFCEYVDKNKFDAGNKARIDTLTIAEKIGYSHISLYRSGSNRFTIILQIILGCIKVFINLEEDDILLLQYPYYPDLINCILLKMLKLFKKIKKFKIIILMHDIPTLRSKYSMQIKRERLIIELKRLMVADRIICHNENMMGLLNDVLFSKKYTLLGPFDYLYDGKINFLPLSSKVEIVIAGNLSKNKSGYIYNLPFTNNTIFNLYGAYYESEVEGRSNVVYKGKYAPNELIAHLRGNFGLVWDGESCESCIGPCGEYLRYNNPHKFSLYIAAGLPVIIWRESALSQYVIKKNLGLCIDSIDELGKVLESITNEKYKELKKSVLKAREEMVKGEHLRKILENSFN